MYHPLNKEAPLNPWQRMGAQLSGWSEASPAKLGIVEDEGVTSLLLAELARNFGFQPEVMANGGEARQRFTQAGKAAPWDLVVVDLSLPDCDGLELLQEIKLHHPEMPCMVLTSRDKATDAVKALRSGAAEYAVKPIEPKEFFSQARMIVEKARWEAALRNDRASIGSDFGFPWKSRAMIGVKELFRHALTTTVPVLIEGEAGVGKYALARGIHHRSHDGEGDLVEFSGGEVDEEAFNLAVFGGEVFATGLQEIRTRRRGLFSQSRPSTLLLRGVENLPLACQERLCRALEAGSGRCRVIAMANKPLEELVSLDGSYGDLFYQLATLRIPLPSLRLRQEDLFALAEQILSETCVGQARRRPGFGRAAYRWLKEHDWPGNISELRLVIEVALELTSGAEIGEAALASGAERWRADFHARKVQGAGRKLDDLERAALVNALKASGGNRRRVATKLGVSLRTVYNMLERHGLKGRF